MVFEKLSKLKASLIGLLCLGLVGCMSTRTLQTRLEEIHDKHKVNVRVKNPWSRCYLSGYLPGLLKRMDKDLEKCPDYFKENIGEVRIEEWFFDNPELYTHFVVPGLTRGYVNSGDKENNFPIHMKNRSLLEKILFFAPRDKELFLHEATHSFCFNVMEKDKDSFEKFEREWLEAQGVRHLPPGAGMIFYLTGVGLFPPLGYTRVPSMPSLYGWLHHWEDIAETNCYLRRHNNDVEFLREKDESLYKKCKVVGKFTEGKF